MTPYNPEEEAFTPRLTDWLALPFAVGIGLVAMLAVLLAMRALVAFPGHPGPITSVAPIRIACLGDSVTAGFNLNPGEDYPAQLETMLGDGYEVRNFGVNGATVLRRSPLPFWEQPLFRDALEWRSQVAIFNFGLNDSRHDLSQFEADYTALVRAFRAANPRARLIICVPTPAFTDALGIREQVMRTRIAPAVQRVAKKEGAQVVDLHAPMISQRTHFGDGVHPDASAAADIARIVAASVRGE